MKKKAYFATAEELERLGPEAIPPQMISGKHLIYSSPATLAFNSPGAEGFPFWLIPDLPNTDGPMSKIHISRC